MGKINIYVSYITLIPHGHCFLWNPGLVLRHVASDTLIAIAYFSILLALIHFVRQRQDLPYPWIFQLFGAFIVAFGPTHAMDIWTLWHPHYWISGGLKASTALVSPLTATALTLVIPRAIVLPSRQELEQSKRRLEERVKDRTQALQESEERLQMALAGSSEIGVAVPWGLLINELISNSLKYAFSPNQGEEINIRITPDKDHTLTLLVAGSKGLPAEINIEQPQSLGLRMVKALTRQLSSTLTVNRTASTAFKINFPQFF